MLQPTYINILYFIMIYCNSFNIIYMYTYTCIYVYTHTYIYVYMCTPRELIIYENTISKKQEIILQL